MNGKRRKVAFDPAVDAILGDAEQRKTERTMTPAQRERARRQAKRKKVTYELDPVLVDLVQQVAAPLGLSASSVASRFLFDALERYAAGKIDFDGYLVPSRGPRFQWTINLTTNGLRDAVLRRIDEAQQANAEGEG